ncbi:MAG TPA: hypothetical protein VFA33_29740 [Bryobacteraceae bacterium]|nr:hypothetical protein [Bryobacteraceae bacterium]
MNKRLALCLIFAAAAVGLLALRGRAEQELDPLKVCADTQKLIFENQFVRVVDDRIPAGGAEAQHRHRHGVVVYLTDYKVEQVAMPGHKVTRSERKFGAVTWSEAVVHEVKNIGDTPSHAIRIELKY